MNEPISTDLVEYLTQFAAQDDLIRQLVVVRPDQETLTFQGGAPPGASARAASSTPLTTQNTFNALTAVLSGGAHRLLWCSDGAVAMVPLSPAGRDGFILAETIAGPSSSGVILTRLASLARYLAGDGERPSLRRHRSN